MTVENKLYPANLIEYITTSDGSSQKLVNFTNLQHFQNDVIRQINHLTEVLSWVHTHRPQAIEDYKTTKAVAMRLQDNNDFSEEDMRQEMQVTP